MANEVARRRALEFAHDLRDIRKANGISIEDVHHESKIPIGLIESFEETGLLDHVIFNRVYLRSFVRTYADVIGVSPDLALDSLEAALDGTYDRRLAAEHLEYERPAAEVAGQPDVSLPPREDDELDVKPEPSARSAESELPELTRVVPSEETAAPVAAGLGEAAGPDWTSQSPPPGTALNRSRRARDRSGQWFYLLVGVVVLGVVVWGVMNAARTGAPDSPVPLAEAVESPDEETFADEDVEETPEPVVLGDTMFVTITAATDKVEDIKVRVDDDLRRPYWLDLGESRTFYPTQQIIIERELENIGLTLQGVAYPTDRREAEDRIVISRETALQFLSAAR